MNIVVFDVCGTLYNSNTTFDFLDYHFAGNKKYKIFKKLRNNFLIKAVNHVINKYFHIDWIRKVAIDFLKGVSVEEIALSAEKFVANELQTKKLNQTHELFNQYRGDGYKVILMSASLDFIIKEIHKQLDADDYYSTQLQVINNKYTGRVVIDQTSKKAHTLKQAYTTISDLVVVSDNLSDYTLVDMASQKHIICWKQKHHDFWQQSGISNITFLDQY